MARRRHRGKLSLLSDDIKPVVRQIGKRQRNIHPEIWARWVDILGKNLAARAIPQSWRGGKLYIAVANSAWMQEIGFLKQTLLEKFADAVGPNVVKDIRLVLDPTIENPRPEPETDVATPTAPPPLETLPENMARMTALIEDESVKVAVENALKATWNKADNED